MSLAARCSAILLTLALGVSAFAQTASNANKQADPTHPVIGVQLYSVRNEMKTDLEGTLEKVKAMGFTYIETGAQSGKSAAEFKALLDKNNFQVVSFFADYNKLKTDFASVVADAKTMNAKYVIVAWIPHQKEFTLADCELAIKDFNEAGEKLAKEGLRFAYHIHGYEFVPNEGGAGTLFDLLMEKTNPKFVSMQLDTYHVAFPGQDPVKLMQKYPGRFSSLHLKDIRKEFVGDNSGAFREKDAVPMGQGKINWLELLKDSEKEGIKWYILEDETTPVWQNVQQSLKYLETIK